MFTADLLRRPLRAALLMAAAIVAGGALPAAAQTAEYRVVFTATWSADTHPESFPANPHFSPLIGGTHDGSVTFWEEGQLASLGIQRMAEWGSQTPLDEEVQAAIDAGAAEFILRDDAVPDSPGTASLDFTVSESFSLVTLVAMVAPSPDWFVGVSGLDLRPGGAWAESLTVTLWPWDAGTDSGPSYSSPDQPTMPHEPISAIIDLPLGNGVPLGTFEFVRLDGTTDVPDLRDPALSVAPNPFNPATTIRFTLPAAAQGRLDIHGIDGRTVATLAAGSFAAGRHEIRWDGRDGRGRRVASGAYLGRLVAGDVERTVKMVLVGATVGAGWRPSAAPPATGLSGRPPPDAGCRGR